MALVAKFKSELRSSLENPQTPLSYPAEWLLDLFNGGRTDAGIRVSEMSALNVSAVYACVKVLAESVASLPCMVYERMPKGRRTASELDIFDLLHDQPNSDMSSFTFFETLQAHCCLWGNCYAEIQRDNANRIVALWPRRPDKTRPRRDLNGVLFYETTDGSQTERAVEASDMVHIPAFSLDGVLGMSVIQNARQAIGLSLATEKFGAKWFGNGSRPAGVLTYPGKLAEAAQEKLKKSWQAAQGGENSHKVAVLEEGLTWQQIGIPPEDAQFLETRKFQRSEIAAFFRVPSHMIGDLERATHSNIEQQSLEFVIYTLRPWLVRFEKEFVRKLFPKIGRHANKFYPEFYVDGLLRGDFASRQTGYSIGRQWGWLSANDVRDQENLNDIGPQGDIYLVPMNMVPADQVEDQAKANDKDATDGDEGGDTGNAPDPADATAEGNSKQLARFAGAYFRLFRDAVGRVLSRDKADFKAHFRAFAPVLFTIVDELYRQSCEQLRTEAAMSTEVDRFVNEYVGGIAKRSAEWQESEADEIAGNELGRAVRALMVAVYRDAATQKALQEVK